MAPCAFINEDYGTFFFLQELVKLDPRIVVLKIFHDYQGTFFIICSYFLPIFFSIFHNKVIIYNTRNWGNDTTESQKEKKPCFSAHAEGK